MVMHLHNHHINVKHKKIYLLTYHIIMLRGGKHSVYLFSCVMCVSSCAVVATPDILTLEGVHILPQGVLYTTNPNPSHQSPLWVSYGVL